LDIFKSKFGVSDFAKKILERLPDVQSWKFQIVWDKTNLQKASKSIGQKFREGKIGKNFEVYRISLIYEHQLLKDFGKDDFTTSRPLCKWSIKKQPL